MDAPTRANGINLLTFDQVMDIHFELAKEFEASNNPISPPGCETRTY
jgi:hypothetical protein